MVVGDRVFLSAADEAAQTRTVFCCDRKTGALLWQTPIRGGAFVHKHGKNSHASPTPACDGRRVYVPYLAGDALRLSALDAGDGRIVWQSRIGPFVSEWGYASSPVLYKDLVVVVGDNRGPADGEVTGSYLAAVNRQAGQVVWRVNRPLAPSYGTPLVASLAGRDQLVLSGAERIVSYNPATGEELWSCRWSGYRSANSVVCGGDCVYASTTWPHGEIVCVRANGTGDVTKTCLVWRQGRNATDVPSPLYHAGRLYLVNDRGLASCLDGATGQPLGQKQLGGAFSASPVLAGNHILATDEEGTTYVLEAEPSLSLLARNALDDPVLASPALSGDRLFLRGRNYLWCLDGQPGAAASPVWPGTLAGEPGRDKPMEFRLSLPPTRAKGVNDEFAKRTGAAGHDKEEWGWLNWLVALELVALMAVLAVGLGRWLSRREGRPAEVSAALPNPAGQARPPAASLAFACPACGKKLRAKTELAGKRVKCPQCGRAVPVPGAGA